MSSGFYSPRRSFLHRLHPVTKILALLFTFVSAFLLNHPLWLLLLGLIYLLLGLPAGVIDGLRRVGWLLLLVAFASFLIWSLAYSGERVLVRAGPLKVTVEGMLYGAGMGVRLDIMALTGLIFLAATPVEEFTYGLTRLGLPFPLSFALSLSFRLVPLFSDTLRIIQDAQRARGLEPEAGSVFRRLRSYLPLFVPVLASALRRTDLLALALESKGFGLPRKRGSLRSYQPGWRDAAVLLFLVALLAGLIVARLFGLGQL